MKTSKYAAVPLAVGLALAAASPAAASPAAAATRVTLTNADDGRNVILDLGDDVEVRLSSYRANGLTYTWSIPVSSVPLVLRRTSGSTTPNGGAQAVFHAESPGVSTITAVRHCRADPGRTCPLVVVPWKITAEVR
ncbi:hypothetical protein ACIG3E_14410 [Streptomyces sp. NPDC053474]|uniref:hypothetical protein n=1 Tax=Streptomyces sp. NPDC053474 TaxID=3365704 RepID=UPI0037D0E16D